MNDRSRSCDTIEEHLYLVSRGVRALAIVGTCESDPLEMLKTATTIEGIANGQAVPFVVDREDGFADYGFASSGWAVDLFRWTVVKSGPVSERQRGRILGLLLGYAPEAIARFEDQSGGRCFRASEKAGR